MLPDNSNVGALVTVRLRAGGKPFLSTWQVVSISVTREVNRIPSARLVLLDGEPAQSDFPLSAEPTLQPGKEIEILAGYDSQDKSIFKGIITRLRTRTPRGGPTQLILECRDKCVALTYGRKSACHRKKLDSDVLKTLIGKAGLRSRVDVTQVKHPDQDLVQFDSTDWDFVVSRAEANGMVVFVEDGTVIVKRPVSTGLPKLSCKFGVDILDFEAQLEDFGDRAELQAESWDPATRSLKTAGSGTKSYLQHGGARPTDELKSWLGAAKERITLARVVGWVVLQGNSNVLPGDSVSVLGIGKELSSATHFVSGVEHEIAEGNWTTKIEFGLSPRWFHQQPDISQPPAAGLLPAVAGLQIGVVTQIQDDPQSEFRVQVNLPLIDKQRNGIWARLARLDAGPNRGAVFLPEVGDEVVLGFLADDPRDAIILGTLHSKKNASPIPATEKNPVKGFTTRTKLQLLFDDEKKLITLATPGGNSVVLDEENKQITLTDQNKNSIVLSDSGIQLTGKGHTVELGSNGVAINSKGDITLKATGTLSLQGLNVEAKADVQFKATGQAGAEVSTSAIAVLKGSLVQIN